MFGFSNLDNCDLFEFYFLLFGAYKILFRPHQRQTFPVLPAVPENKPFFFCSRRFAGFFLGTLRRAATVVFGFAFFALNEKQMTPVVGAVGMGVAGFSALVAVGDNLAVHAFAQPFVEYKVFTDEF
jgi:hypothetical protein